MTALHLASRNGHVNVATALLEKGAAIDLTDLVSLSCVLTLHVVTQNGVWFSYTQGTGGVQKYQNVISPIYKFQIKLTYDFKCPTHIVDIEYLYGFIAGKNTSRPRKKNRFVPMKVCL